MHIVWCYIKLFEFAQNDPIIAQVTLDNAHCRKVLDACPIEIPDNLQECGKVVSRGFHPRLRDHTDFDKNQEWFLDIKTSIQSCRCSGCLQVSAINYGDLHFFVNGLFYDKINDNVVKSKLRFCPKRGCVTKIKGNLNNIK